MNAVVKNLDPAQTYYFRACGQDQKAGSAARCGTTAHFGTAPADSLAAVTDGGASNTYVKYTAAPATAHDLVLTGAPNTAADPGVRGPGHGAPVRRRHRPGTRVLILHSSDRGLSYYDTVSCTSNKNNVTLNLSGYDDYLVKPGDHAHARPTWAGVTTSTRRRTRSRMT